MDGKTNTITVAIDGYEFEAEDVREGILINPVLPEQFGCTPNEDRPGSHDPYWDRPYIQVASRPDGDHVVVRCLDGGAWDRPTMLGHFPTIEEAILYIKTNHARLNVRDAGRLPNFRIFGVGGRTPYPASIDGAVLDIGPGGINLISSITKPSEAEIRSIRDGRLEIGMIMYGAIAVLLWRFHDCKGRKIAEFDSIFHMGLLPPEKRQLPFRGADNRHQLLIVLQDERAICRALRRLPLPADVSKAIDDLAAAQMEEVARSDWNPYDRHAEVVAYFSEFPTPAHAFALTDVHPWQAGLPATKPI